MTALARLHHSSLSFTVFAWICVLHALVVLLVWAGEFYIGMAMISGRTWLALAWLWLVWPFALSLHPAGTRKRVILPVVIGIILLAPCVGSIFLFTVWALERLAP
jgi:hypothetical protein